MTKWSTEKVQHPPSAQGGTSLQSSSGCSRILWANKSFPMPNTDSENTSQFWELNLGPHTFKGSDLPLSYIPRPWEDCLCFGWGLGYFPTLLSEIIHFPWRKRHRNCLCVFNPVPLSSCFHYNNLILQSLLRPGFRSFHGRGGENYKSQRCAESGKCSPISHPCPVSITVSSR